MRYMKRAVMPCYCRPDGICMSEVGSCRSSYTSSFASVKQQTLLPWPLLPSQRQYKNVGNKNTYGMRNWPAEWEARIQARSTRRRAERAWDQGAHPVWQEIGKGLDVNSYNRGDIGAFNLDISKAVDLCPQRHSLSFKDPTVQSPEKTGLNSVLNLIWAGDWTRDVLRRIPSWMLQWVNDSSTRADL